MLNDEFIFDFDGVICDSAFECFLVTFLVENKMAPSDFSADLVSDLAKSELWKRFEKVRPLGNNGGDFVFIFQILKFISG